MTTPRVVLATAVIIGALFHCATEAMEAQHAYMPSEGYVPNSQTAITIAEAVLVPIYGKEQIDKQKPLKAALKNAVWTVTGTLPEGMMGGVAEIAISKRSGKILRVTHGK